MTSKINVLLCIYACFIVCGFVFIHRPYAAPQAAPTAARQQFPPVQRPTEQSSNYHVPSSSAGNSRNRGLRCELPSDFLRVSHYPRSIYIAILI